jgi:hypothetical protein
MMYNEGGRAATRTRYTRPASPAGSGNGHTLYPITMLLWWLLDLVTVPSVITHQLGEPHPQWRPLWEWLGQPALSPFFLVGCASALPGLALAASPSRNTCLRPTVATER